MFPRAVLFDMDDTLISAYRLPQLAWVAIAREFEADLAGWSPADVAHAVSEAAERFWSDESRHRPKSSQRVAVESPISLIRGRRTSPPQNTK